MKNLNTFITEAFSDEVAMIDEHLDSIFDQWISAYKNNSFIKQFKEELKGYFISDLTQYGKIEKDSDGEFEYDDLVWDTPDVEELEINWKSQTYIIAFLSQNDEYVSLFLDEFGKDLSVSNMSKKGKDYYFNQLDSKKTKHKEFKNISKKILKIANDILEDVKDNYMEYIDVEDLGMSDTEFHRFANPSLR